MSTSPITPLSTPLRTLLRSPLTAPLTALMKNRPCVKLCGPGLPGSAELVLLRQVLGLCLRLSIKLSAECPSRKGG
ncbi:hypothetical protein ACI2LO_11170 [Streptomyces sp. NPDC033754]|uniref:hypothetical protein n=1 Tax=unclassified Streptomyces TaxID=2593676 RepID=UPI0033D76A1C